MVKHIFSGTATALITPFTEDGKDVEYNQFEKLVNFQIERKIDALVVSGTTGESPVLTRDEKINLFHIAVNNAKGLVPVIAGTGSNNTEEAVRKSNDAEKQGVNGLLIVTPYYNKCNDEGLLKHYQFISDRVSTPIIVYNVPSRTGVTVKPDIYKELANIKNIVAVKEASGNISDFIKTVSLCDDKLDFYSGNDDQTVAMMSYGAKGVISVVSNIIPDIMSNITRLCLSYDYFHASEMHKKYLSLMNSMFCETNPIPIKSACNMLLGLNNSLRLPLTKLSCENLLKLRKILQDYELI